MLSLGHTSIGKYNIWITLPMFTLSFSDPEAINSNYFIVFVSRQSDDKVYNTYINLIKSDDFKFLFSVDKNYRPLDSSCDMVQYNYYVDNKESVMPLWKLSKNNVLALINKCKDLNCQV